MQAAAAWRFVQLGLYISAIHVSERDPQLCEAVLEAIRSVIDANAMEPTDDAAVQKWLWDDLDRSMLTMRFSQLKGIQEYRAAWRSLRFLGLQGVYSLLRIERELLRKVRICCSFSLLCSAW